MLHGNRGFALLTVLILLGIGSLLIVPTLRYTSAALKLVKVSREQVQAYYALDALTNRVLWEMKYDDEFTDCGKPLQGSTSSFDGIPDSFNSCVALWGSWTFTTATTTSFNETQLDKINGQDVSITVEVPGALTAPPEPVPTPSAGACLFDNLTRDPTWSQVNEDVTYTAHITNCSSNQKRRLRRVVALLDSSFTYVGGSTSGDPGFGEPDVNLCTGIDLPVPGCEANDGALNLAWPGAGSTYNNEFFLDAQQTVLLDFKVIPSGWGVFYVDISMCFFDPGGCDGDIAIDPLYKKAPVVVGMFNLRGRGKGNNFSGSTGGGGLISKGP